METVDREERSPETQLRLLFSAIEALGPMAEGLSSRLEALRKTDPEGFQKLDAERIRGREILTRILGELREINPNRHLALLRRWSATEIFTFGGVSNFKQNTPSAEIPVPPSPMKNILEGFFAVQQKEKFSRPHFGYEAMYFSPEGFWHATGSIMPALDGTGRNDVVLVTEWMSDGRNAQARWLQDKISAAPTMSGDETEALAQSMIRETSEGGAIRVPFTKQDSGVFHALAQAIRDETGKDAVWFVLIAKHGQCPEDFIGDMSLHLKREGSQPVRAIILVPKSLVDSIPRPKEVAGI